MPSPKELTKIKSFTRKSNLDCEPLSDRESEVLEQLSRGACNKEIASSLGISVNTVEKHLANIYVKLGVRTEPRLCCAG